METTAGHLLGGRLRYAQPRDGYRTGIEPVLLAASIPAQPGQRVLEAGTGAGAGLLCLSARVPGLRCTGVEIDPAMADLARQNMADNRFDDVQIVAGDITAAALGPFDHAFANPPWHDRRGTSSPVDRRRRAKQSAPGELERWIEAMRRILTPTGSLTLILPAAQLDRARAALGSTAVRALHPKRARPPKLLIIQSGTADPPPTILHQDDGRFTPEIEAILRQGAAFTA